MARMQVGLTCPRCSAAVKEGSSFCARCGCPVGVTAPEGAHASVQGTDPHTCQSCGASVPGDSTFCPSCGARIEQQTSATSIGHVPAHAPREAVEPSAPTTAVLDAMPAPASHAAPHVAAFAGTHPTDAFSRDERMEGTPVIIDRSSTVFAVCGSIIALCVIALVVVYVISPRAGGVSAHTEATVEPATIDAAEGATAEQQALEALADLSTGAQEVSVEQTQEMPASEAQQSEVQPTEQPGPATFEDVTASSTLKPDHITSYYGPLNAVDNDMMTAWNEGAEGTGAGEWIRLEASSAQRVHGVRLVGGYAKTNEIYYKNNRPRVVTVTLSDGYVQTYEMADAFGAWQTIDFGGEHETTFVQVEIDSVYGGTTWNDCSFTEVSVY